MKLNQLFNEKTVFSFEVFPPKKIAPVSTIFETLDSLKGLTPDFISVTYGAGGSKNNSTTIEIARTIREEHGVESVAHLPSLNFTKEEVSELLDELQDNGIENILALRGDRVEGIEPKRDFQYASDLVTFIQERGDFNLIGACYPEVHPEASSTVNDIHHLKQKVDAGCSQLITQLFFDNQYFYQFRERCQLAGIEVPIQAGIMPVINKRQIERMVKTGGVELPQKFIKMMEKFEHQPEAMRDAGIAYAVNQIVDLVAQGADGIHLYTMNNPYVAEKIREATASLFIPKTTLIK